MAKRSATFPCFGRMQGGRKEMLIVVPSLLECQSFPSWKIQMIKDLASVYVGNHPFPFRKIFKIHLPPHIYKKLGKGKRLGERPRFECLLFCASEIKPHLADERALENFAASDL